MSAETFTLTFCECGENDSRGMEKIGTKSDKGISIAELVKAKAYFDSLGAVTEIYNLRDLLQPEFRESADEAAILIIRNGVNILCRDTDSEIECMSKTWNIPIMRDTASIAFQELKAIPMDKQTAVMRKPVIDGVKQDYTVPTLRNKNARHNICIADFDQAPDIINGKGTIVNYSHLPAIGLLRKHIAYIFGLEATTVCEINDYFDAKECGINFHGDTERRKVIGARLGYPMPLYFRWHRYTKPFSTTFQTMLNHGDIYVMSEKAVGCDWRTTAGGFLTLRHAAGYGSYGTKVNKSKSKK